MPSQMAIKAICNYHFSGISKKHGTAFSFHDKVMDRFYDLQSIFPNVNLIIVLFFSVFLKNLFLLGKNQRKSY